MSTQKSTRFVQICEEGPREGFQSEPPGISTADKVALIEALAETGLQEINCCSFVNPQQVPQMADAEAVITQIRKRAKVKYTGLWLNQKGFERAQATPVDLKPTLVTSASETFGMRNTKQTRKQMLEGQRTLAQAYKSAGLNTAAGYVFTAFGCNYEGEISPEKVLGSISDLLTLGQETGMAYEAMYLCDTIGTASPHKLQTVIDAIKMRWPDLELALHLHDTRGTGLTNAYVGLQMGIRRFDASVGGLGGCPFAGNKAAAGNICTEDLVYLCLLEGYETGIDLDKLIASSLLAERIVGRKLPGKIKEVRLPSFST
ncbi:hydroxymethylglutaryl-CoA lyase [Polaromonas hydrogenivorans]|uniref:Hydroxymethylglutaryl-CoA lyase n=1 Tax=Polaromonas hydrogenivorans TaxID=335476 RepID=A0AAU7LZS5_9BURK